MREQEKALTRLINKGLSISQERDYVFYNIGLFVCLLSVSNITQKVNDELLSKFLELSNVAIATTY